MASEKDVVERVARAIDEARCPGREGPYGGYDYGYDRAREIDPPVGGRYVVRDFRDPSSKEYGKWVHQTADRAEHEAAFKRLTDEHVARVALSVLPRIDQEVVEALKSGSAWLRQCSDWMLSNDLDMGCPMETDPLDIADAFDAALSRISQVSTHPEGSVE